MWARGGPVEGEDGRERERGAHMVTEAGEGDQQTAAGAFYGRKDLGYAGSVLNLSHGKERRGGIQLEMWSKLVGCRLVRNDHD